MTDEIRVRCCPQCEREVTERTVAEMPDLLISELGDAHAWSCPRCKVYLRCTETVSRRISEARRPMVTPKGPTAGKTEPQSGVPFPCALFGADEDDWRLWCLMVPESWARSETETEWHHPDDFKPRPATRVVVGVILPPGTCLPLERDNLTPGEAMRLRRDGRLGGQDG